LESPIQYTVRQVPREVDRRLRDQCAEAHLSLNEATLEALRRGGWADPWDPGLLRPRLTDRQLVWGPGFWRRDCSPGQGRPGGLEV